KAAALDEFPRRRLLDLTFLHELEELRSELRPGLPVLSVRSHHLLGWSQLGGVDVFHTADRVQEVGQIVLLGESGELGDVVDPDVDDPASARVDEEAEELLSRLL